MIFWLDAHLDPQLAAWMGATFGIIVKTLDEIGLPGAEDETLFTAARTFGQIVIVSKDYDFVELVEQQGAPPQVLWLNCGNLRTLHLQVRLRTAFPPALELLRNGEPIVEID